MGKSKINNVNEKKKNLLAIEKDDADIKKYQKLLKIKNKKRSFISDIFSTLDAVFSDEEEEEKEDDVAMDSEDDEDVDMDDENMEEECDVEDESIEDIEECEADSEEESDKEELETMPKIKTKNAKKVAKAETVSELHTKIKRNLLQHFNKLGELQMMKCLDGVEEVWNSFPRGDVRDVFIKESLAYMKFSCLDLAAFVVCIHIRFSKHSNMIAFYMEHMIDKLTGYTEANWENDATFSMIMSMYKFIAYVTRLETIDCNLILDIMTELVTTFALPQLKVVTEISSIVGFYLRKNSSQRCEAIVKLLRDQVIVQLSGSGDMDEMKSYAEAIISKLTSSKAKSDVVYQSVDKYRKLMKKWCRNESLMETIALKLADFRGDNRVRWWLVGSAIDPSVAHNKSVIATTTGLTDTFSDQERQWNGVAKSLGFCTVGKQTLFRVLMSGKEQDDQENIGDTVEAVTKLTRTGAGGVVAVSEGEMVRSIIRCLSLEEDFCQFYVNVLAALLESHRRFRQIVKCAIWDVLAQPKLVESARSNCGRCVGQLIAMAGLPVNSLKKFNFLDSSEANTAFMKSAMTEIFEENWDNIAGFLRQSLDTISVKFVGNLRLFLKKNFKIEEAHTYSRATVFKVTKCMDMLQELRKARN